MSVYLCVIEIEFSNFAGGLVLIKYFSEEIPFICNHSFSVSYTRDEWAGYISCPS